MHLINYAMYNYHWQQTSSFRLSVCLSVCHTFFTMFPSWYHHEIFRSYYQWPKWYPCKRSRSKDKGQGHRAIKIVDFDPNWAFLDCNSSLNLPMVMQLCTKLEVPLKRCPNVSQGHLSNFKVTHDKQMLILTQIWRFRIVTPFRIHRWLWNDARSLKKHRRGALLFLKVICQI